MTAEEFELLTELATVVHTLSPPDAQRRISRKYEAMMAAYQRAGLSEDKLMPNDRGEQFKPISDDEF